MAGFFLCVLLIFAMGDIGMKYGITYSVYIRSAFGKNGAHIAGLVRVIAAVFFTGFQTYVAATALNIIGYKLIGFSNIWVALIIFQSLQVWNAAKGVKSMAIFDTIATVFLAITLVLLMFTLLRNYSTTLGSVLLQTPVDNGIPVSYPMAIAGAIGGWIALAPTFMDITRNVKRNKNFATQTFWQRNKYILLALALGVSVVSPLNVGTGMVSGIVSGTWNPIEFATIAFADNWFMMLVSFLAVMFAQWSTNTGANMLPAANIIVNFWPKRITYSIAMVIVGVVSLVIMPWKTADVFNDYLGYLATALGPILGIMMTDYFIIRKGKLNVEALFHSGGQYSYWKEYNPAALIAFFVPLVIGIIFIPVAFQFYACFAMSMVMYWALMQYWIIPKYPQAELEEGYVPNYHYDGTDA